MHKFSAGQTVEFSPSRMTLTQRGPYSIVRLVPEEKDGPQYRIKSEHEQHERVAHERDLTASSESLSSSVFAS